MPNTILPFEHNAVEGHGHEGSEALHQCGLYQILPKEGKEIVEQSVHVLDYLHMIPLDVFGTPKFHKTLSKKLRDIKHPNLIYPVSDKIAIHICADKNDARNYYIPIEPFLFSDINHLTEEVERRIATLVTNMKHQKMRKGGRQFLSSA